MWLNDNELELLEKMAVAKGVPKSTMQRIALLEYAARHGETLPKTGRPNLLGDSK